MAATLSARTAAAAAVLATRYRPPTTAIKPPRKSGDHPEIYPLVAAVSVGLCLAVFEAARTLFLCPTVKLNKAERMLECADSPEAGARYMNTRFRNYLREKYTDPVTGHPSAFIFPGASPARANERSIIQQLLHRRPPEKHPRDERLLYHPHPA